MLFRSRTSSLRFLTYYIIRGLASRQTQEYKTQGADSHSMPDHVFVLPSLALFIAQNTLQLLKYDHLILSQYETAAELLLIRPSNSAYTPGGKSQNVLVHGH